jgi:hypothetical protein
MTSAVAVGLIDSGVAAGLATAASARFTLGASGTVVAAVAGPDRLGHGTSVAALILRAAPSVRLLVAQVFDARAVAAPASVAAALDWLVAHGARLVNMSVGLTADRAVLRAACLRAVEAGVLVVAAVPAIGPEVFPAAYPGIVRVTGDARCQGDALASLPGGRAAFGASPRAGSAAASGASIAAARVSAALAAVLAAEPDLPAAVALARLAGQAVHHGAQRLPAAVP